MPISRVLLESEMAEPRDGEMTIEKKASKRRDSRLIILQFDELMLTDPVRDQLTMISGLKA